MILTDIDNNPVHVDIIMIKQFNRRGSITVLKTQMGDKLLIKETPAEIIAKINEVKANG